MKKKISYNFSDLSFLERFKDTGLKFKIANDISVIENFIDQDMKHDNLLQTNYISESVYLYYNPFKTNYGKESVFNVMICNAYYYNQDIIFKIRKLTEEYKYYYNDEVINDFIDLFPYFKDYSKGFKDGYRNFEDDIKKRLNSYSKQEDFFDKIFEFVTNNDSWKNACKFTSDGKSNLINGYDEGLRIGKFYKAWQFVFLNDKHFKPLFDVVKTEKNRAIEDLPNLINSNLNFDLNETNIPERKFIAKEYALAYIFDLWANGEQIPQNRVEGGLNKKALHKIGENISTIKNDTFYRAVKLLASYDLNNYNQLQSISKDWQNAVRKLSNNWIVTKQYLMQKQLYRE